MFLIYKNASEIWDIIDMFQEILPHRQLVWILQL